MTSLPPALAAWAEPLSLFPPELALSLGQCIRRLAQAVGPLPRPAEERSDDPNGYEGLARRGSYERLLISEWLLADEVPEEFLRRAAQKEHAFLALSFHRPGGSRRSLALFDAGPELIGEPRIGQLAALVVLSQRARRDGAAFGWGVLQDEQRQVLEEVTPATILRLLFSRTARTAQAEDAESWAKAGGEPLSADDLWVVGTPRTVAAGGPNAGRVELEDPLEPGKRDLLATIRLKGAAPRSVELPLPKPPDCVRLLRDPFSVRRAPPPPSPLARGPQVTGLAFAQNGRRLMVRSLDWSVSAHPIPNSPRMPPGAAKRFELQGGEELIAAGWMRGSRVVLVRSEKDYCLHGLQRQVAAVMYRLEGDVSPAASPHGPLPSLLVVPGKAVGDREGAPALVFLDAEGHLFALRSAPDRAVRLVRSGVLACGERDSRLHVIYGEPAAARYAYHHSVNGEPGHKFTAESAGGRAFISGDSPWLALERTRDQWSVFSTDPFQERLHRMTVAGSAVFGVTVSPKTDGEPVLMVVEEDRRSVGLLGLSDYIPLIKAPSPIVQAVANARGPEIALLGVDGAITVLSPEQGKVLELKPPQVPVVQFHLGPPPRPVQLPKDLP
ncbi:MAG TPA: hypothetical protein VFA20_20225 [Myxococcaceae bacterium]|nr:hypothetical protein [Myxococcaceae bacterium]